MTAVSVRHHLTYKISVARDKMKSLNCKMKLQKSTVTAKLTQQPNFPPSNTNNFTASGWCLLELRSFLFLYGGRKT